MGLDEVLDDRGMTLMRVAVDHSPRTLGAKGNRAAERRLNRLQAAAFGTSLRDGPSAAQVLLRLLVLKGSPDFEIGCLAALMVTREAVCFQIDISGSTTRMPGHEEDQYE
jgi:hypothetical protein